VSRRGDTGEVARVGGRQRSRTPDMNMPMAMAKSQPITVSQKMRS
jgi:hypothetical protein